MIILTLLFGLLYLVVCVWLTFVIANFIGDFITLRVTWGNTWKDCFILAWAAFKDRFEDGWGRITEKFKFKK